MPNANTVVPTPQGSRWYGNNMHHVFVVIHEVETDDGHTWIHYRDQIGDPPREYSCYKESFLQRFTKLPD